MMVTVDHVNQWIKGHAPFWYGPFRCTQWCVPRPWLFSPQDQLITILIPDHSWPWWNAQALMCCKGWSWCFLVAIIISNISKWNSHKLLGRLIELTECRVRNTYLHLMCEWLQDLYQSLHCLSLLESHFVMRFWHARWGRLRILHRRFWHLLPLHHKKLHLEPLCRQRKHLNMLWKVSHLTCFGHFWSRIRTYFFRREGKKQRSTAAQETISMCAPLFDLHRSYLCPPHSVFLDGILWQSSSEQPEST